MKKIIALLLAITFIFSLSACKSSDASSDISGSSDIVWNDVESEVASEDTQSSEDVESSESAESSEPDQTSEPTHTHTFVDATCTKPQKCSCGETKGSALGHDWQDATCTKAKTCSICNMVQGAALGHKWNEATCETPKVCSVCKVVVGVALGHKWSEATCKTPKICGICKATEGKVAAHKFVNGVCTVCNTKDPDFKDIKEGYWEANIEGNNSLYCITLNFGEEASYGYHCSYLATEEDEDNSEYFVEYRGKTYVSLPMGDGDMFDSYAVNGNEIVFVYQGKKMTIERISNESFEVTKVDSGYLEYGEDVITVGSVFEYRKTEIRED